MRDKILFSMLAVALMGMSAMPAGAQTQPSCAGFSAARVLDDVVLYPAYPFEARKRGEEGMVTLTVTVSADGRAAAAAVANSSGFSRLDNAVRDWVLEKYRFAPGTMDCKPVESRTQVKLGWRRGMMNMPAFAAENDLVFGPAQYPPEALELKQEGEVTVQCQIAADGRLGAIRVIDGSGHGTLDQRAMNLIRARYTWVPAQANGKPVATVLVFHVRWTLDPKAADN